MVTPAHQLIITQVAELPNGCSQLPQSWSQLLIFCSLLEDLGVQVHAERVPRVAGLVNVQRSEDLLPAQHTLGLGQDFRQLLRVHPEQVGNL